MKKIDFIIYFLILIVSIILDFSLKGLALIPLIVLNIVFTVFFIARSIKQDAFNIALLFILNYMAYVLYIPIKVMDKDFLAKAFPILADRYLSVNVLLISGIVAVFGFAVGYNIYNKEFTGKDGGGIKRKIEKLLNLTPLNNKLIEKLFNVNYFSNMIILLGLLIFAYAVYRQGGIGYILSKYQWNSDNDLDVGFMTTGVQIILVGVSIAFYSFLDKEKSKSVLKCYQIYIFVLIALIKLAQGGRIQILMGAITLIMLYHYKRKKISLKLLILAIVGGYMLLGFIGYFRDYKSFDLKNYRQMLTYIIGGSGGLEYYLNSYTIFSTMYVITTKGISYIYGASLLDGIIFLVPRVILPGKEGHLFLMNKIQEMSKVENISPLGGLNLAAQNLINGYVIFTILFMFVLGLLLKYLSIKKSRGTDIVLLYSLIAPFIIVSMVRNPIYYSIKEIIQFAIIPYFAYKLVRLKQLNTN